MLFSVQIRSKYGSERVENPCRPRRRTANAVCAEIEISKRQEDTIHKIFLDPTGNHLLACLHGGETYYLHSSTARPKRLLKWSGVVVEAVGFDAQRCTEVRTPVYQAG